MSPRFRCSPIGSVMTSTGPVLISIPRKMFVIFLSFIGCWCQPILTKRWNIAISAESSLNHRNPHGFLWWTSPALITHLGVSEFCHSPIPRPLGSPDISQRGGACTRHEPSGGAGARRLDWRSDHGRITGPTSETKKGMVRPQEGLYMALY